MTCYLPALNPTYTTNPSRFFFFCCVPIYVSLCNLVGDTHTHFPNLLQLEVIRKHTLPNILKVGRHNLREQYLS